MRITVNNLPNDAERFVITSSGADAPDIAGEAIVRDVTGNDATLVLDGEGSRNVTYRLGALKNGSGFRSFFIPLPVGTYPDGRDAFSSLFHLVSFEEIVEVCSLY